MFLSSVLIVAIYQLSFSGVEAVQCYECNHCGDPFVSNGVPTTYCNTTCMKSKGTAGGFEILSRGCGTDSGDNCAENHYQETNATVCTCTTDLCNEASLTIIPVFLVITMATILLLAKQLTE